MIAIVSGVVVAVVAPLLLRVFERRRLERRGKRTPVELLADRTVRLAKLEEDMAAFQEQLKHNLGHIGASQDLELVLRYVERSLLYCGKVRDDSRNTVALTSPDYVAHVKTTTDPVIGFLVGVREKIGCGVTPEVATAGATEVSGQLQAALLTPTDFEQMNTATPRRRWRRPPGDGQGKPNLSDAAT